MNIFRSWWLRRHGVCPVHLTALVYSHYGEGWIGCDQCAHDRYDAVNQRVVDTQEAAKALAERERGRK